MGRQADQLRSAIVKDATSASRLERATAALEVLIVTFEKQLGRFESLLGSNDPGKVPSPPIEPPIDPEAQKAADEHVDRRKEEMLEESLNRGAEDE